MSDDVTDSLDKLLEIIETLPEEKLKFLISFGEKMIKSKDERFLFSNYFFRKTNLKECFYKLQVHYVKTLQIHT